MHAWWDVQRRSRRTNANAMKNMKERIEIEVYETTNVEDERGRGKEKQEAGLLAEQSTEIVHPR